MTFEEFPETMDLDVLRKSIQTALGDGIPEENLWDVYLGSLMAGKG